ncbi:MAG: AraC family transcriptional regulator [Saprospiraceae bacterium]|nr:AraC family transcriptional regulator [Saprospiraceae bacterium]
MSITFNLLSASVFFLIANGLFVSFLLILKKDNKKANQYLSLLALLLSLWLCDTFFRVSGIYAQKPSLYFLPIYFSFAFGPLLYFYTISLTHTKQPKITRVFIHFIPAILQGIGYVFLQWRSYNFRRDFWLNIHQPYTYDLELALSCLSLVGYLYFSWQHIIRYRSRIENNYSSIRQIALRWLNQLHWVLFLVSLFWFLETIARVVWGFYPATPLSSIIMGVILILIAVGALLQSDLTAINQATEVVEALPDKKALTEYELQQLQGIKSVMRAGKLYLKAELTLKEFADYVQLPSRETSRLINQGLNQSFIDFVNDYRVKHFKYLVSHTDIEHLSLLGVALESGFKSKSTFNRVFKKREGQSPSEFVRRAQNMN